ncbi:MAG: hypothetical protein KJ065_24480 [Anaerolineae bacterium]|nr:hypothetical protein [Anaerolineae bacterium]
MDRKHTQHTRAAILLLLLSLLGAFALPALSQADEAYPIALVDDDLFLLLPDGTRQQLTTRPDKRKQGYTLRRADIFPSPNGRFIIYRDVPDFIADAWLDNQIGSVSELPTDLFLIDLDSGEELRFAAHAPGTAYRDGRLVYRASNGHAAAWSPAGTEFAYIERIVVPDAPERQQLLVYDAVNRLDRLLAQVVAPETLPGNVIWTDAGIAAGTSLYSPDGDKVETPFLHGGVLIDFPLLLDGKLYVTVNRRGHPAPEGTVFLFDLLDGEYYSAEGYVSVVSATAPETSLVLVNYQSDTRPEGVYTRDGTRIFRPSVSAPFPVDFVLSPDGLRFSYVEIGSGARGSIVISADGEEAVYPDAQILGWGAPQDTLFNPDAPITLTATTELESEVECGPLPAVELVPGQRGIVLGPDPNRLRAAPSLDAAQISVIPGGGVFDVVAGQQNVCGGGSRWAQVRYADFTGWTAMTGNNLQLVQPIPQRSNKR